MAVISKFHSVNFSKKPKAAKIIFSFVFTETILVFCCNCKRYFYKQHRIGNLLYNSSGTLQKKLSMRTSGRWWIIAGIMILVDFYFFSAVRFVVQGSGKEMANVIYSAYWAVSAVAVIFFLLIQVVGIFKTHRVLRNYLFAIIMGLFIAKLVGSAFFIVDDLRRLVLLIVAKIFPGTWVDFMQATGRIDRSAILTWIGILLGSGLFIALLYGFSNKHNYKTQWIKLSFDNLPAAFRGLKIVQLSDIHSGSFRDKEAVA